VTAYALAFFSAPMDAVEGLRQKIFYLHVPLAIVALGGFVAGGAFAVQHLRTGDRKHDLRSYVAIHMALIFGVGTLVTGSIWARAAWGHWWLWSEPLLVSFLIVFLLYACYQPLRFAIEDPERQARYASVFAVVAGVFVPVNFAAVRFGQENTHPRTLSSSHNLPGSAWLAFGLALLGMTLLYVTLCRYEMSAKRVRGQLRRLRRRLGDDVVAGRSAAPL
jgi:heme exporter protein C